MAPPKKKKISRFYDSQITPQERLTAFEALPPRTKELLNKAGYKPGSVPTMAHMDALMGAAIDDSLKEMVRACATALTKRDVASVNGVFLAVKNSQLLNVSSVNDDIIDIGVGVARLLLQEHELKAYTSFRAMPSFENYRKCWAAKKNLDMLGIDEGTKYPVNPWPRCKVKPPRKSGLYVVVKGDWLSKIAERYYGQKNLWDAIFESNDYDGHPDRITPGSRLTIYEWP